jgi:hypothetical protein
MKLRNFSANGNDFFSAKIFLAKLYCFSYTHASELLNFPHKDANKREQKLPEVNL